MKARVDEAIPITAGEFNCTVMPCEDSEDMLVDAIKFLLELAAATRQQAA